MHWALISSVFTLLLLPFSTTAIPRASRKLAKRRDAVSPDDFSWIKSFTAIGDSYAAGIGAGDALSGNGDSDCARYNGAYSQQMNLLLGPSERAYNFIACSGALAPEIKDKQVTTIADNSQDLITVSAGGNDALFSDALLACIYTPSSDDRCNKALSDAEKVIKDQDKLWKNIDDLVTAIDPKLADGGIVIWTLYGQFFNTESDAPCSDQTWDWFNGVIPGGSGLKVTKDLRGKMNDLVAAANKKIQEALISFTGSTRPHKMNLIIVDWDGRAGEENGRFCNADSANDPNDPSNVGLIFQRLDPTVHNIPSVKRRNVVNSGESVSSSRDELTKRGGLDSIKRVFHPTVLGGSLMAAMAISQLSSTQSKGWSPKPCPRNEEGGGGGEGDFPDAATTCNGDGWKTWSFREPAHDAITKFCGDESKRSGTGGDIREEEYNQGTSDHIKLTVDFKTIASPYTIEQDACEHYFGMILDDNCDVFNIDGNPLNIKHGGVLDHPDGYHIELQPQEDEPARTCAGLEDNTYLDRDKLKDVILDGNGNGFCKDAEDWSNGGGQTPRFSQKYTTKDNPGPDADLDVLMVASWPAGVKINKQECADALKLHVLDHCDGSDQNPYDYKGGGDLYIGSVSYVIQPLDKRTPVPTVPAKTDGSCTGNCDSYCGKQEWSGQGHNAPIDKGKMQKCLDDVFTNINFWSGPGSTECDEMVHFHSGSYAWYSGSDCYNACKNCLSENVNDGASAVWCDAWAGSTHGSHCWLGFDQNA